MTQANNISGVPVVKDGKVVGIVTGRDTRFETNLGAASQQYHDWSGSSGNSSRRRIERKYPSFIATAPY